MSLNAFFKLIKHKPKTIKIYMQLEILIYAIENIMHFFVYT